MIRAARPLFSLVLTLRQTAMHPAVARLREHLIAQIEQFHDRLQRQDISQSQLQCASYALCALLDETIMSKAWGSELGNQTLLVAFHREAVGGEKFFQFLQRLMSKPDHQNLDLIELLWLCLALGFKGQYGLASNGERQLEQIRDDVYQLIRRLRPGGDTELSVRWRGLRDTRNSITRQVPLWVVALTAVALLVLIYLGFLLRISGTSDSAASDVYAAGRQDEGFVLPGPPLTAVSVEVPSAPFKADRFRLALQPEIRQQLVEVVDDRILRIRNSFAPGSDRVKPEFLDLLGKIARELRMGRDTVLITGHTDDKPIRTLRFPSNFELSESRARQVADIIESSGQLSGKVKYEGRSDGDPLVPNDSAEHRAINRGVDILIQ